MRRVLTASFLALLMTTSTAFADDSESTAATPGIAASAAAAAQSIDLHKALTAPRRSAEPGRPMMLPALYVATGLLQGYDAYSTLAVLKHGGVEANPIMKGVTKQPALFVGLKAGMATMSIMSAERMWKRGQRTRAVVTMVASNAFMGWVAHHNSRVLADVSAR